MTQAYLESRLYRVELTAHPIPKEALRDTLAPDSLRPGDVVGCWLIEGYVGRGAYGVVYRARRVGRPDTPPVALKLAVFAYDPRFMREAALLSRIHHPAVPQLLDRGWWVAGPEASHPYTVMEWCNGLPLYEWAREHGATSRQVLRVLAQVAGALAALHQADGLHRDVKGDNVRVTAEGRAMLMDYGSGTWAGAPPITETLFPPNTLEYRSPESRRFEGGNWRTRGARYQTRPADDLYALGVTLYRLVTWAYPPPGTEPEELKKHLQAPAPRRPSAQELNERVVPELSTLIEQLLANEPDARGSAAVVEETAEAAAAHVGTQADVPLFNSERPAELPAVAPAANVPIHVHGEIRAGASAWRPGLVAASLFLAAASMWWASAVMTQEASEKTPDEARSASVVPGAKTQGLGDTAQTEPSRTQTASIGSKTVSLDMPKQPLPGQRRPPCRQGEKVIHGACWRLYAEVLPPCGDDAYEWQGACYNAPIERKPPPTSEHPE